MSSLITSYFRGTVVGFTTLVGVASLAGCGGDDDSTGAGGQGGLSAGSGGKGGTAGTGHAGDENGGDAGSGESGGHPNGGKSGHSAGGEAGDRVGDGGEAGEPLPGVGGSTGGHGGSMAGTGGATGGTGGTTAGTGGTTGGVAGTGGTVTDPCASVDCSGHGTCSTGQSGAQCACDGGYAQALGDPTSCVDIDECAIDHGGCDSLTTCKNFGGGFECSACPPGYDGSGTTGCVPRACGGEPEPTCACIRVAPDGDDAEGSASGGVEPFRNVDVAIAFAAAHRNHAQDVCVAAGAACGATTDYAGPAGANLVMRDGISVFASFESTGWTRCTDSSTTLTLDSGYVLSFGADVTRPTTFEGFKTGDIVAQAARGAMLRDLEAGNLTVSQDAEVEARGSTFGPVSVVQSSLRLTGSNAGSITLDAARGSVVKGTHFSHLDASGDVRGIELSYNVGGDASVRDCEGSIALLHNEFAAQNFTGSGSAVALSVEGSCEALIDSKHDHERERRRRHECRPVVQRAVHRERQHDRYVKDRQSGPAPF